MEKVTSSHFYKIWLETVTSRKKHLLSIWRNPRTYTSYIKGDENSVMDEVATKLNLLCYPFDYYSIDTILYLPEDKTPRINENSYWFRDIRVAFEHENNFRGGLYQEVSHLLITQCDLRVLVTYPTEDSKSQLDYLHEIILGSRQSKVISDEESFLIILDYEAGFEWEGLIFKQDNWNRI
jgi:hypothetical protein